MHSMTYGTLPKKSLFIAAFEKQCPEGYYEVGNDKIFGDHFFSCEELWREICRSVETHDEELLDFASCVLFTLGIEWV